MSNIPARGNLRSMSRTDIQKLCKNNNIKANMRTDEMINALCDLVNGKEVPRPHRSASDRVTSQPPPVSRQVSEHPSAPPKANEPSTGIKKAALQPSESNTDAESVSSVPPSAPPPSINTRRRAKDLQMHLGKGRPIAAGGKGARKITSRGGARKAKTSAMLQEPTIVEEDEVSARQDVVKQDKSPAPNVEPQELLPSSGPGHLPTPAPSQASVSFPVAQINALESRIHGLESVNLDARLQQLEQVFTSLPSAASFQQLNNEVTRLNATHAALENHVKELIVQNNVLKLKLNDLEAHVPDGEQTSLRSIIIHPSPKSSEVGLPEEEVVVVPTELPVPPAVPRILSQDELPNPSPSQPTLGKRPRCDTPDASFEGITIPRLDPDGEAIERVVRPLRKRPRLDNGEEIPPFMFGRGPSPGPTGTSTPKPARCGNPSRPEMPNPSAKVDEAEDVIDMSIYLDLDAADDNQAEASKPGAQSAAGGSLAIPSRDPSFFAGAPLFNMARPVPTLPFPIRAPKTPPNSSLDPAPLTTPRLGEPWKPETITAGSAGPSTTVVQPQPRERPVDKFHPYFTPGRRVNSSSRRHGMRGFSATLKSPAPMPTLSESTEQENPEGSPSAFRTRYGTEMDGDTRFGDYGRVLGKDDLPNWLPRQT